MSASSAEAEETEHSEVDAAEEQIRIGISAQARTLSELKGFTRWYDRLKIKSLAELLDVNVSQLSSKVDTLIEQHADNFRTILDYESTDDVRVTLTEEADDVQDTYSEILAKFKRLQRQQEAYDTALQTRHTIEGLLEQETLVGTIERGTIAKIKTDLASIRKVADSTDNNELRVLVVELGPKLTEIVNKSNTQLKLEGHCSLSSSDSNAKPKVVAISSNLKLALPTFDGDVLNWREFWSLFSDVLFKDRGLTDTEKCCHLINSMSTPEAKEQAKSAVAYTTSYAEATDHLNAFYKRNRLVFSHHYKAIFASDLINCTRKDLQRAMDKIERHCLGMKQANGYTADQMVAIHFEQCMSSKLVTPLRQFTYDQTNPPTSSDFLQFLKRQSLSAPDDKSSHSPKQSSPKQERILQPKHRLIQRKSVLKMQLTPDKCITCNAEHPLYLSTGFKKLTLEKKLDVVKRNKLCYNCLSSRHLSSTCKSKSNCKECGAKHHTLLHNMSPTSDAEGAAGNVNLVRPGFKQVKGNTLSLARTVLTLVISD